MVDDLLIVGGGPAGMTAGIYAARHRLRTLLIAPALGGQVAESWRVENYLGYPSISGVELAERFEDHLGRHEIERERDAVIEVARAGDSFRVRTTQGKELQGRTDGERTEEISVGGVFVEIGAVANTEMMRGLVELNEAQEMVVDRLGRTSVPGVFAAGDVTDLPHKQIVIAAGQGATAFLSAYDYLLRVKIREGVRVIQAAHKAPGGLIRVTARTSERHIDDIALSGDFFFHPPLLLSSLEEALRGERLEADALRNRIADFYARSAVQSPGVSTQDWVAAILLVREQVGT